MPSDQYKTNEYFRTLERSDGYRTINKMVAKALEEQWEDLVLSGIINEFYEKYKSFFVRRRGKKAVIAKANIIKADENNNGIEDELEVKTPEELKQQAADALQNNKLLIDGQFLNMAALVSFLTILVDKKIKGVEGYYKFNNKFYKYLKDVFNKAGQSILDLIEGYKGPTFKMTSQTYLVKLKNRLKKLAAGVDGTTKKKFVDQMIKGLTLKETKKQLTTRLQSVGIKFSKTRAKQILNTETQAAFEFMRFEAAKLNGVKYKIWITTLDERVCPLCAGLHGTKVSMETSYQGHTDSIDFLGLVPPAHVSCKCYLEYEIASDDYLQYLKKVEPYVYYEQTEEEGLAIINPNAIWAGGKNLVGKDKHVGEIYHQLRELDKGRIKDALATEEGKLKMDMPNYFPNTKESMILSEARQSLTDIGFIQLLLSLGFKRKIPAK